MRNQKNKTKKKTNLNIKSVKCCGKKKFLKKSNITAEKEKVKI